MIKGEVCAGCQSEEVGTNMRRNQKMKHWHWRRFSMALLITLAGTGMLWGCDSGEKVVDEVTGNRAVKQYHKSKAEIGRIVDQQAEKYNRILGDDQEAED